MEKIHKKVREEIIERMKKVINVKKDIDLAIHLAIMPQTIADYKRLGISSFYKRIVDFCTQHNINVIWLINGTGKIYGETSSSGGSTAEETCKPGIPFCTPEELKFVSMVVDVLRGVNEQDKHSLMMIITSLHRNYMKKMPVDPKCLEGLKKNIQKVAARNPTDY